GISLVTNVPGLGREGLAGWCTHPFVDSRASRDGHRVFLTLVLPRWNCPIPATRRGSLPGFGEHVDNCHAPLAYKMAPAGFEAAEPRPFAATSAEKALVFLFAEADEHAIAGDEYGTLDELSIAREPLDDFGLRERRDLVLAELRDERAVALAARVEPLASGHLALANPSVELGSRRGLFDDGNGLVGDAVLVEPLLRLLAGAAGVVSVKAHFLRLRHGGARLPPR